MKLDLMYTLSDDFSKENYLYKLLFIGGAIFHIEFRYITAWSLGMVSFHISGLSYNASTKQFDKTCVTKMIPFFFDSSMKVKAESWNMSVQAALRKYIY